MTILPKYLWFHDHGIVHRQRPHGYTQYITTVEWADDCAVAFTAPARRTLDNFVREVLAIAFAAQRARPDVIILCHRGPTAMHDDAQYVLSRT